tara:strand:- start:42 stop:293 length:252 start_codon:yes stop_codon:yes gene_type:complete
MVRIVAGPRVLNNCLRNKLCSLMVASLFCLASVYVDVVLFQNVTVFNIPCHIRTRSSEGRVDGGICPMAIKEDGDKEDDDSRK